MASFPLLSMVALPFLETMKLMNTIDLIRLNMGCSEFKKIIFKRYVSLGKVRLSFLKDVSFIGVGNFTWICFQTPPSSYTSFPLIDTMTPFSFETREEPDKQYTKWFSVVEDTREAVLIITGWILKSFPSTKNHSMFLHFPTSPILKKLNSLKFKKFGETRIAVNKDSDDLTHAFFEEIISNVDVGVIHFAGKESKYKVASVKTIGKEFLPLDTTKYFENFIQLEPQCHYVVFSGLRIREAHITAIIQNWVSRSVANLVSIHVKSTKYLDVSKIINAFTTEEWNDGVMEAHRGSVVFSQYFNQKGIVIRSQTDAKASFHVDNEAGTLTFVVWDLPKTEHILALQTHSPI